MLVETDYVPQQPLLSRTLEVTNASSISQVTERMWSGPGLYPRRRVCLSVGSAHDSRRSEIAATPLHWSLLNGGRVHNVAALFGSRNGSTGKVTRPEPARSQIFNFS